ncbi:hypothetical protein D3C76_1291580 [compost metagenome]
MHQSSCRANVVARYGILNQCPISGSRQHQKADCHGHEQYYPLHGLRTPAQANTCCRQCQACDQHHLAGEQLASGFLVDLVNQEAPCCHTARAHKPWECSDPTHLLQADAFGVYQIAGEPGHEEVKRVVVAEQ